MSKFLASWVLPEDTCKEDPSNFLWDGELAKFTKSCPAIEQCCIQNLAWVISCCFSEEPRVRTKSDLLVLDQALDMGCQPEWHFLSFDSAAIRIRIQIVLCERPANRRKSKPCETKARLCFPLLPFGSKESVLKVPIKEGTFGLRFL